MDLYHSLLDSTERGQRYHDPMQFLADHVRTVHSTVGAMWLSLLPGAITREIGGVQPGERSTHLELICHLAAMLAFAHDLALRDKTDKKEIGLRSRKVGKITVDALNFETYPLCTLFGLVDVLQEFGRPVHVLAGPYETNAVYVAPIAGLKLTDRPAKLCDRGDFLRSLGTARRSLRTIGIKPFEPCRMGDLASDVENEYRGPRHVYVSYLTQESGVSKERDRPSPIHPSGPLLTCSALTLREPCGWEEKMVGSKVGDWLADSLLSPHVRLDGHAAASAVLEDRSGDWKLGIGAGDFGDWALLAAECKVPAPASNQKCVALVLDAVKADQSLVCPVGSYDGRELIDKIARKTLYPRPAKRPRVPPGP